MLISTIFSLTIIALIAILINPMQSQVVLTVMEKLPVEAKEKLEDFLEILVHRYIPEYAEELFPEVRSDDPSPDIQAEYEKELDKRLERSQKDPHPGFTLEEIVEEMEEELGRKLQI
ncbi:MAG: hypothetical protein AAF518_28855 [Spirochaetota bacterium]